MKIFRSLFFLFFIALTSYSCEPEELPENPGLTNEVHTASTGEKDDDVEDRGED